MNYVRNGLLILGVLPLTQPNQILERDRILKLVWKTRALRSAAASTRLCRGCGSGCSTIPPCGLPPCTASATDLKSKKIPQ